MHVPSNRILAVAVTAIAAAVLVAYGGRSSGIPEESDRREHVVTLTDHGFVPAELSVRSGELVTFTSEIGKQYWPASNLHPDHSIYPEFDPRRPLLPDEKWQFTFEKKGAWRFHDHLRSYYTGVIYVE